MQKFANRLTRGSEFIAAIILAAIFYYFSAANFCSLYFKDNG